MKKENIFDADYKNWLVELKGKIRSVQVKAAIAVNSALIGFYWDLGKMITEKQAQTQWGDKLISQLAEDLKVAFPDMQGLSSTNLKYCKRFYNFYQPVIGQQVVDQLGQQPVDQLQSQPINQFGQQPVAQLPWGHNILIFSKSKTIKEAMFYMNQTIENNWSRDVLALQIKQNLFGRQGKAITNFKQTLPAPLSDLADQTLKDPYIFDFMALSKPYREKDIENQLIEHITKFLLELGKGFAFIGRQYHLAIGNKDYYMDLLFYHTRLKCHVVIEIKNTSFMPEYAGKLNFYLSAVDSMIKQQDDNPTIGILLCRDKDSIEAEFALRDINKPMGVSEFQFTDILPENLKSSLPTIEEIENELRDC